MHVKTAELIGRALDWAVAMCEGGTDLFSDTITWGFKLNGRQKVLAAGWGPAMSFCPSADWAVGGPIVERERINLIYTPDINCLSGVAVLYWLASVVTHSTKGPTPLIAAMRCYVASKLGNEVEIPDDLVSQ